MAAPTESFIGPRTGIQPSLVSVFLSRMDRTIRSPLIIIRSIAHTPNRVETTTTNIMQQQRRPSRQPPARCPAARMATPPSIVVVVVAALILSTTATAVSAQQYEPEPPRQHSPSHHRRHHHQYVRKSGTAGRTPEESSSPSVVAGGDEEESSQQQRALLVVDDWDFDETNGMVMTPEQLAQEMVDQSAFHAAKRSPSDNHTTIIAIPTYFHILQESSNEILASESRIYDYMNHLNKAFRNDNTPFTFVLQDITRTVNYSWSNNGLSQQQAYKSILKQGGRESLNIYLVRKIPTPDHGDGSTTSTTLAGFAYLPASVVKTDEEWRDGIVIQESYHGDVQRLGTLVHETGHCTCVSSLCRS
jgi:hypothetical protein